MQKERHLSWDWLTSDRWIPDHFRDDQLRLRHSVLRLGLLFLALISMWQYGLAAQSWLFIPLTLLSALYAWGIPTLLGLYTGAWLGFAVLRGASNELGFPNQGVDVAEVDRLLGAGVSPVERLQQAFYVPGDVGALEIFAVGIHSSFFVIPHLAALLLWWRDRSRSGPRLFPTYLTGTVLVMVGGLITFVLVPVAPPWMVAEQENQSSLEVYRITERVWSGSSSDDQTGQNEATDSIGDENPVAALPSLHTAIPLLMALVLMRLDRRLGWLGIAYALAMGFSLVYLGEHYLVDVLTGPLLAFIGAVIAMRLVNRFRGRGQPISS